MNPETQMMQEAIMNIGDVWAAVFTILGAILGSVMIFALNGIRNSLKRHDTDIVDHSTRISDLELKLVEYRAQAAHMEKMFTKEFRELKEEVRSQSKSLNEYLIKYEVMLEKLRTNYMEK